MRLPHLLLLFLLLPLALWAGQQKDDLVIVAHSGADGAYARMRAEKYLTLANIEELSSHKVSSEITLRYLLKFQVVYKMDQDRINQLKKAGVSEKVIDYLVSTVHRYGSDDRYMDPNYDPFHGYDEDYFRLHHYYPPSADNPSGSKPW
jgi:hypothetical protein